METRVEIGPVGVLTLCRPDRRNAMTREMGDEVAAAVQAFDAAPEVRVVVVRGEGRSFCAGGDLDMIEQAAGRAPEENRAAMRRFYASFLSILRVRVPTVAVLHGAAVGAGLCFAAACDLRYASEDAKLGLNFVRIGLHPGMAASVLIPRLVGAGRAADLLLTGRLVQGREAESMGLVNRAVPASDLEATVGQAVEAIASAAPIPVTQCKGTLQRPLWREIEDAMDRESYAQAIDFASQDLREAVRAFRESRAPRFEGR
jgi:enoyl-CoA hydratase